MLENNLKSQKMRLHLMLLFSVSLLSIGCSFLSSQISEPRGTPTTGSTPLISRNVPAYASSGNANDANDADFNSLWWSNGTPASLMYDLSGVPAAERNNVLLVWYNETYNYDHTVIKDIAYNVPGSYTIDVNSASGGTGSPPTSGWRTAVTVTNNHYHSRQHVVAMHGANWIRLNVTVADGSVENYSARINMDVYDASHGLDDDFIAFGDSITAGTMGHDTIGNTPSLADLIHKQKPNHFPIEEAGGIGGVTSDLPVDPQYHYLQKWLSIFPGKYVGLSYGTNDSFGCSAPAQNANAVYQNYVLMVKSVLAAQKTPIVPHMIWSPRPDLQMCAGAINAKLDQLYKAYPQVIPGPDLYAVFKNHPDDFGDDFIHPNDRGAQLYRQAWANMFLRSIYH